jgi:hypothetical protein
LSVVNYCCSGPVGDVNGDGRVNVSDLLLVLGAFGTAGCGDAPPPPRPPPAPPAPPVAGGGARPVVAPGAGFAGGRVFGMGEIVDGEVGWGESGERHNDPVHAPSFGSDVVAIAAGGHQTFALKRDGRVFAAGINDGGQLGDGTTTDRYMAAAVSGLGTDTVELARGLFSSMVVRTAAGQIYGWGANEVGELCLGVENDPRPTPVLLEALGSDNAALGEPALRCSFLSAPTLNFPVVYRDTPD